ncbi:MAG: XRE family transcriptional regulator [Veillonellaceae bacterium]|nr:XRE family transcriptional regulator [Veillonellaceae bacterium]
MDKLGTWIRSVRLEKGLEIKDLSYESGLTSAQISRIETLNSDVTVNSIVRIAYGLNIEIKDVLAELEIRAFFPCLLNTGQQGKTSDIVTIQDVEAFLRFYRSEPRQAKDELINAYHVIRENNRDQQEEKLSEFDTADIVWEATQALSKKYLPIPYPKGMKEETIEEIYRAGGVITIRDLAAYVMACRRSSGLSLRKMAEFTEVSYNAIARLERGELERISFTEITALEKALKLDGTLIAICWAAGEFQTGISRVKVLTDQSPLPVSGWDVEELAFADTLITIVRWNTQLSINRDWIIELKRILSFYAE